MGNRTNQRRAEVIEAFFIGFFGALGALTAVLLSWILFNAIERQRALKKRENNDN
jgi:hypothetical protein